MGTPTRAVDLLLATKFFIPVASQPLVARTRLYSLLNEGRQYRLTLVAAPAGFGKSTLLAQWVRSLPTPPDGPFVAWLSLDEDDDNPARFAEYFITALSRAFPSLGTQALEHLHTDEGPALHAAQTVLINSLAQSEAEYLVVLDDYHYVTDPAIHSGLAYLLDHLPPNVHLFVSSRAEPELPLARLRAKGWLLEVSTDDLRCTIEEGATVLRVTAGVDLTDQKSLQVIRRTEGWLVGLQLLGHTLRGQSDPVRLLEETSGTQEYILDYLTEEVLRGQPKDVQDFLLQTSILKELSPSLCDAVMGYTPANPQSGAPHDSRAMLQYLERANLFLVPLDHRQQWYRYHHLFAEALRYRLERRYELPDSEAGPGGNGIMAGATETPSVSLLHRRAGDWYREHGRPAEATTHALLAEDWPTAVELIGAQLTGMVLRMPADMPTLLRWLERVPEAVMRANPQLCIAYVNALFWTGRTSRAAYWLDVAEATLRDASADAVSLNPDRERMLGDATAKIAFRVAAFEEDGERALALCDEACSHLTMEDHNELSIVCWSRQIAWLSLGRAVEATDSALERVEHTHRAGFMYLHIPALADAGALLQLQGKLRAAERLFAQAIDVGSPQDRFVHSSAALAYIYQADLLREWNRLDEALAAARKGLEIAGDVWSPMLRLGGVYHVLARLHLSRGEPEEASSALGGVFLAREAMDSPAGPGTNEATEAMNRVRFRYMHPWCADAEQVRLWLLNGEVDQAARWAEQLERQRRSDYLRYDRPFPAPYRRDCEDTARARIALARAAPDEAIDLLEPVAVHLREGGCLSRLIEIRLLQALARDMRGQEGDEEKALALLAEAIRLGAAEGFIRSFLDEGAPVANLLMQLRSRERKAPSRDLDEDVVSYVDRLLAAFEESWPSTAASRDKQLPVHVRGQEAGGIVRYGDYLVEPLSKRELEVLALMAQGASNAEIADQLYIALNTVKRHISNIFEKLGVSNRTQAVTQARTLGLLDE